MASRQYKHASIPEYLRRKEVQDEMKVKGADACYIISEDNGGAINDDRNYILCPRGYNCSDSPVGARWDPLWFAVAYYREPTEAKGKKRVEGAIRASQPTGCRYKIKDAQKLVDEGIALFPTYYEYHKVNDDLKVDSAHILDLNKLEKLREVWNKGLENTIPIVPIQRGGAHHEENLLHVLVHFHSIKDSEDLVFALVGTEKLKSAIRISPGCNYKEKDAESHVERGKRRFESAHKLCYPDYHTKGGKKDLGGEHILDPEQLQGKQHNYCRWLFRIWR